MANDKEMMAQREEIILWIVQQVQKMPLDRLKQVRRGISGILKL